MDIKRIYFYGTLPEKGKTPFGGGEVGNLRTVNMLRNAGYNVTIIRQRKASATWGHYRKLITYPLRILLGWTETFFKLLFASRKSVVHLSGFAGKTILNEFVLMHIIRYLGFNVIYEIRGGGIIDFWEKGNNSYKKMFCYLVNEAVCVFSQGKENMSLLRSLTKTLIYYYPNCVEDCFAPSQYINKTENCVNLIFYGRIEEDKHVDMVVEIASLLQKEVSDIYLTIIGDGNTAYVENIKKKMGLLLKPDTYKFEEALKHEDLKDVLKDKHFYIFPSTQPREGQSNSITECMSFGIIPIASPQGFNRSTIGDDNLIVDSLDANLYAKKILGIIKNGSFESLSLQVYNRFRENYTESIVSSKTIVQYKKIFEKI